MRIAIGSDHGGFSLKSKLINFMDSEGFTVADMGTHTSKNCDYPVYGAKVARAVADGQFQRGVLICKSGIGMCMAANKIPGVRAALCFDARAAKYSRLHNDANVLCLAASRISSKTAKDILKAWLATGFEGGRHARRVRQMNKL